MSPFLLLTVILLYFLLLGVITFFTSKDDSNSIFFKAGRNSPWYVVAFGMIGASLSGVTFISVPARTLPELKLYSLPLRLRTTGG